MPKILTFEDFYSQLNQEFQIKQESGKWIAAKLIEANELQFKYSDTQEEDRTSFSLVFHTGIDVHLPQKMYSFEHDELGENQIFLVQLSPDDTGNRYEAVFT